MNAHESLKFISPNCLIKNWDVSRSFLWRLEQAGLIRPAYLYSKKLYALKDVERIETMIANGELRAELRGAARRNQEKS